MGFNSVAFLLNDFMHRLQESPKTVAYAITHPPHSQDDIDSGYWYNMIASVAIENKEPIPHRQALEMLPTFHADCTTFFRAGGNCISKLDVIKYSKTKDGRYTVTLEIPEWASPLHPRK